MATIGGIVASGDGGQFCRSGGLAKKRTETSRDKVDTTSACAHIYTLVAIAQTMSGSWLDSRTKRFQIQYCKYIHDFNEKPYMHRLHVR